MSNSLYIVIVGCGRLGGLLANVLSARGHQIVVVDEDETAFDKLSPDFSGFRLQGDAVELGVLREANIEQADKVFAVTTRDNVNLMVAQIARQIFKVSHVVARVYDPAREAIYREFNIDIISPTRLSAEAFLKQLNLNLEGDPLAHYHDRRQ